MWALLRILPFLVLAVPARAHAPTAPVTLIPGGLVYLMGGLGLLAAWLAAAEARTSAAGRPAADWHR